MLSVSVSKKNNKIRKHGMMLVCPVKGTTMNKFTYLTGTIAAIGALVILSACSYKPPDCSSDETLDLARKILLEDVNGKDGAGDLGEKTKSDIKPVVQEFLKAIKLEFVNITTDGYNANARIHSCHATLKITTSSDVILKRLKFGLAMQRGNGELQSPNVSEVPLDYTTQAVAEKRDFLLNIDGGALLASLLKDEAHDYYQRGREIRESGNWKGTLSCGGLEGEQSGPKGPYSMSVIAAVGGSNIKLERTTRGGGYESLKGDINFDADQFHLQGMGENSPDDRWNTQFSGQIKDGVLTGQGSIAPVGYSGARSCTLNLKQDVPGAVAQN
jgi:hypothetical protein